MAVLGGEGTVLRVSDVIGLFMRVEESLVGDNSKRGEVISVLAETSGQSISERGGTCQGKVHFLQVLFGMLTWA